MDTIKGLIEKRGKLAAELNDIVSAAKTETRAMTDDEVKRFGEIENEMKNISATVEAEQRAYELNMADAEPVAKDVEQRSAQDIVSDFIRNKEVRADEMTRSSTGNILPVQFSEDIIHEVDNLCGIINLIDKVNAKGIYKQILADKTISAGWTDEIAEITATDASFKTIEIGHEKLAALAKMSLELINQNEFNIYDEVVRQMAKDFAVKAETAILSGDGVGKPTGLIKGGTKYQLDAAAITADDIIKIYHTLHSSFVPNAVWIMSNDTLCKLRLLTDGNKQYMFKQGEIATSGFAGTILGKPVLVSDYMDNIESGNSPILFGDFSRAYKANINPEMSMQVLREKYAEFGMVGIVSIMWLDGKPVNDQAYVTVSIA